MDRLAFSLATLTMLTVDKARRRDTWLDFQDESGAPVASVDSQEEKERLR